MNWEETRDKLGVKTKKKRVIVLGAILAVLIGVLGFVLGRGSPGTPTDGIPTPEPFSRATVSGIVVDRISEEPISGAKITAGPHSVYTSVDGAFSVSVAVGVSQLDVAAEGYLAATVDFTLKDPVALSPKGKIIFVSNRDGRRGLYRVNLDGSDDKEFVQKEGEGEDFSPVICPQERYVAFLSTRDGRRNQYKEKEPSLYLVKEDGLGLKKISDFYGTYQVSWSPSGAYVAWTGREREDETENKLAVFDIAKQNPVFVGGGGSVGEFSFSDDEAWVAFSAEGEEGESGIYVADIQGGGVRKISDATGSPSFNQDRNVEFIDYRDGTRYMVWFHDSGETREVGEDGFRRRGELSPDKKLIAYIDTRDGQGNVFVSRPDRSEEEKLTDVGAAVAPVRWTLDGKYITFRVLRQNESARYIAASSGKGSAKKIIDEYGAGEYHGF